MQYTCEGSVRIRIKIAGPILIAYRKSDDSIVCKLYIGTAAFGRRKEMEGGAHSALFFCTGMIPTQQV